MIYKSFFPHFVHADTFLSCVAISTVIKGMQEPEEGGMSDKEAWRF